MAVKLPQRGDIWSLHKVKAASTLKHPHMDRASAQGQQTGGRRYTLGFLFSASKRDLTRNYIETGGSRGPTGMDPLVQLLDRPVP